MTVTAKYKLKFKGAKEILFGDFQEASIGTIEEFWTKLFGGYRSPICPMCKISMQLRHCNISKKVNLVSYYGSKQQVPLLTGPPDITLDFICPQCGSEISGWGLELTLDVKSGWFSLEKFSVTSFKVNVVK